MNSLLIVLPILTILMFDLGLTLKLEDFSLVLRHPGVIAAALFGQIIVLPAVAFAIALAFGLKPEFFIGIILIACCPGGSSSNLFSKLAGGDVALSVLLTALSSLITFFTIPVIMSIATGYIGDSLGISLPVGNLIKQNIVLVLVPVIIGIGVNYAFPSFAASLDKMLSKAVFPALLTIVSIFFIQNHAVIINNIGLIGICVSLLIIVSSLAAGGMSRVMHFDARFRRTIVIEVGMQNAAQAIAIASSPFIFANNEIAIPGVMYSLMMNVILLAYLGIIKERRHEVRTGA